MVDEALGGKGFGDSEGERIDGIRVVGDVVNMTLYYNSIRRARIVAPVLPETPVNVTIHRLFADGTLTIRGITTKSQDMGGARLYGFDECVPLVVRGWRV